MGEVSWILILAAVAIIILLCSSKRRMLGGVNFRADNEPKDACSWLLQDGYSKDVVAACNSYSGICGRASGSRQALDISETFEPFQVQDALMQYRDDLRSVGTNKAMCKSPMQCDSSTPCPNFLGCVKGICQ